MRRAVCCNRFFESLSSPFRPGPHSPFSHPTLSERMKKERNHTHSYNAKSINLFDQVDLKLKQQANEAFSFTWSLSIHPIAYVTRVGATWTKSTQQRWQEKTTSPSLNRWHNRNQSIVCWCFPLIMPPNMDEKKSERKKNTHTTQHKWKLLCWLILEWKPEPHLHWVCISVCVWCVFALSRSSNVQT